MQCSLGLPLSQVSHVSPQEHLTRTKDDPLKTTLPATVQRAWQDVEGMRACLQKAMQHLQAGQEALTQAYDLDAPLEPWQVQQARLSSVFLQRSHTWVHTLPQEGQIVTMCTSHQAHVLGHVLDPSQQHDSVTIGGGLIPVLHTAMDRQAPVANPQDYGAALSAVDLHASQQEEHAEAAHLLQGEPLQLQLAQSNSTTQVCTRAHVVVSDTAAQDFDDAALPLAKLAACNMAEAEPTYNKVSAIQSAPDAQHPPACCLDDLDSLMVPTPKCMSVGPGSNTSSSAGNTNTSNTSSSAGGFECVLGEMDACQATHLNEQPCAINAQSDTVHGYLAASLESGWACEQRYWEGSGDDSSGDAAGQHESAVGTEAMLAAIMMPTHAASTAPAARQSDAQPVSVVAAGEQWQAGAATPPRWMSEAEQVGCPTSRTGGMLAGPPGCMPPCWVTEAHSISKQHLLPDVGQEQPVLLDPCMSPTPAGGATSQGQLAMPSTVGLQQLSQPDERQWRDKVPALPLETQVHALLQGVAVQGPQSPAVGGKQHGWDCDAECVRLSHESHDSTGLLTHADQTLQVPVQQQGMSAGASKDAHACSLVTVPGRQATGQASRQADGRAMGLLDIIWHADGSVQATLRRGGDEAAGTALPQQAGVTQQMLGLHNKVDITCPSTTASPVHTHGSDGVRMSPNPLYKQEFGEVCVAEHQGAPGLAVLHASPAPDSPTQHSCANPLSTRNPLYEPSVRDTCNAAQQKQPMHAYAHGKESTAAVLASAPAAGTAYVASLRRLAASRRARQQAQLSRQQLPECGDQELQQQQQQTLDIPGRSRLSPVQSAHCSDITVKAVQQQGHLDSSKPPSTSADLPAACHTGSMCSASDKVTSTRSSLADLAHASDWEVVMHSRKLTQHILQQAAMLLSPQGKAPHSPTSGHTVASYLNGPLRLQDKLVAAAAPIAACAGPVVNSPAAAKVMAGAVPSGERRHSAVAVVSIDVPCTKGALASSPAAPEPIRACP